MTLVNRVLEAAPGNMAAQSLQGKIYISQNKLGDAEAAFRRALRTNPKAPGPYLDLATVESLRKDQNGAILILQKGLAEIPGNVVLSTALAEAYQRRGQIEKE